MYYPHTYSTTRTASSSKNSEGTWSAGSTTSVETGICRFERNDMEITDDTSERLKVGGIIYIPDDAADIMRGDIITVANEAGTTLISAKIERVDQGMIHLRVWV